MTALGFGQWTETGFASTPAEGPEGEPRGRLDAAYMAMSDYLLLTAEIPEGGAEDVEAWVSKNLPRFFPDEPDRHPFDVLPRARGAGRSRQVLFTSADCLSEYRNAFPKVPLASILTAFREPSPAMLGPTGDFARIVAMPGWIEWASREGGVWTLGQRIDSSGSTRTALSLILSELDGRPAPLPVQLIHHPDLASEMEDFASRDGTAAVAFPIAFDKRLVRRFSHFDRESRKNEARAKAIVAIAASAALFVALNAVFIASDLSYKRAKNGDLALIKRLKASDASDKALVAEHESLLSGSNSAESFPSAHSLLSALSAGLGPGARLIDLSEENGSFTVNLETANALASLSALQSSGSFSELKISGIKAADSGERFCLTGRYREKR